MFIKFNKEGIAEAAPKSKKMPNGSTLLGYNSSANRQMLIKDGYIEYLGNVPLCFLQYKNGRIIENYINAGPVIFSKLEIRRAMRALNIEYILNDILEKNHQFRADWNDSTEINLNDPVFQQALIQTGISDEILNKIIKTIHGS